MTDTHTSSAVKATGDDAATVFPSVDAGDVAPLDDPPARAPRRGPGRPRKDGKPAGSVPPAPKGAAPKATPGRPSSKAQRAARVAGMYEQLGGMLGFAGVVNARAAVVGAAMSAQSKQLGEAWAAWAETNARVAKLIDGMSFGGAGVAVLLAHLPIALALTTNPETGGSPLDLLGGLADLMGGGVFGSPAEPAPTVV
jgi:hypothetical protein